MVSGIVWNVEIMNFSYLEPICILCSLSTRCYRADVIVFIYCSFAFAETESSEEIEKAKSTMEGVEIQGRKLRVRR